MDTDDVDTHGIIVADTRAPDQFIGHRRPRCSWNRPAASRRVSTVTRSPMVMRCTSPSRSDVSGWTTALAIPVDALDGPLRRSMLALIGIGVSLCLERDRRVVLSHRLTLTSGRLPTPRRCRRRRSAAAPFDRHGSQASWSLTRTFPPNCSPIVGGSMTSTSPTPMRHGKTRKLTKPNEDQFLAMCGHELRNPLSPIVTALGCSSCVAEPGLARSRDYRAAGAASDPARRRSTRVSRSRVAKWSCNHARSRSSPSSHKRGDASPCWRNAQHQLSVDVTATGLSLTATFDRLAQVLANLLSTPPNTRRQADTYTFGAVAMATKSWSTSPTTDRACRAICYRTCSICSYRVHARAIDGKVDWDSD